MKYNLVEMNLVARRYDRHGPNIPLGLYQDVDGEKFMILDHAEGRLCLRLDGDGTAAIRGCAYPSYPLVALHVGTTVTFTQD